MWLRLVLQNTRAGSFRKYASAKSARSFLAIANKRNCGNLHRITFNLAHVSTGLKNVYYRFLNHQIVNKALQHQSLRSLDSI